tara:strand:- start:4 stop:537 length:534 start_codon:yes stop_codon:yes gene_type:complete
MLLKKIAQSWGSYAWYYLHYLALNYNPELKKNYINLIRNFHKTIPCIICKNNFGIKLKKFPINNYLKNKEDFFKWTVLIHNDINKKTYKKIYSVDEAKKLYINNYNKNNILLFLQNFYKSNFKRNNLFLLRLFNEVINTYPNNDVKNKLIDFRKNCKIKNNKLAQWYYVYINVIKNN